VSDQVVVIVSDLDDAKHAQINVVESVPKAARLVETLLEAGFDQSRIRVFVGGEMGMEVRQRPIVTLGGDDKDSEPVIDDGVDKLTVTSSTEAESPKQKVAAELYQQNGVRFSAAFRPA
jgi:hypothetical protein